MLPDGVYLLLAFNLARGSIGGLLRTLKILQGLFSHPEFIFPFKFATKNSDFQYVSVCFTTFSIAFFCFINAKDVKLGTICLSLCLSEIGACDVSMILFYLEIFR